MQKKPFYANLDRYLTAATLALACCLTVPSSAAAFDEETCAGATILPLNASVRSRGGFETRPHFFRLRLPAAGLVSLEVAVPGSAEVEATLRTFGGACDDPGQAQLAVVDQTATGLVLTTETPGTYLFAVAAQDPRSPLGDYRITAGFVAAEGFDPGPTDELPDWTYALKDEGESDDEIEVEPDFAEPDSKGSTGSEERQPGGQRRRSRGGSTPDDVLRLASPELCRQLDVDDHGDTSTCATRLHAGQVTGYLDNAWGDDYDLFVFTLTAPRTVLLTTTGEVDTFGSLYDRHGQRLKTDDDGGDDGNFRMVKPLAPGTYFVRIEGSYGAEGPYGLRFETLSW
jgi:hypothetical protein